MNWIAELERMQAAALYEGYGLFAWLLGVAADEARRIAREKEQEPSLPQSGAMVEAPT